jgi:hypothetical protein
MFRRAVVALVVGVVATASASAADPVSVKGSSASYPQSASVAVGGNKTVKLNLTGVGLRKRVVTVYAIASYVQEGVAVKNADDVVKADAVRLLHIVMERNVDPDDFIAAFRGAVAKSYPEDKFAAEFKQLSDAVGNKVAAKGDNVYLISTPGAGVRIRLADKVDVTVKNPAFARALWEVYLGANPIDETLKQNLVGMLSR